MSDGRSGSTLLAAHTLSMPRPPRAPAPAHALSESAACAGRSARVAPARPRRVDLRELRGPALERDRALDLAALVVARWRVLAACVRAVPVGQRVELLEDVGGQGA